jgi:hypothetical protein
MRAVGQFDAASMTVLDRHAASPALVSPRAITGEG